MNKRERLEKTINGEAVDRPAVALWRHFPGDDQRAADLARAILNYQYQFEWDFVVAAAHSHYSVSGYGLQEEWQGNPTGEHVVLKPLIQRSLDWTELRALDPTRGDIAKHIDALRLVGETLDTQGTPYLALIYSPLAQARRLSGETLLLRHLRTQPDRLRTGLNTLTETTLRQIEALRKTNVAGIYYVAEMASYDRLTAEEYLQFGLPYDSKIMEALIQRWWMNVLQVVGEIPMLQLFVNYPVQVVNWHDKAGHPKLIEGRQLLRTALMGGLSRMSDLRDGTPNTIRDAARRAFQEIDTRHFILSAEDAVLATTPFSNLIAARDIVKPTGV
jgi:uroporphyrinogen decarboxylase